MYVVYLYTIYSEQHLLVDLKLRNYPSRFRNCNKSNT